MTVCGIICTDRDSAVAWADTEAMDQRGAPAGLVCKLAVNAAAGVVGTGAGQLLLADAAVAAMRECMSLDAMPARIRTAQRRLSAVQAERWEHDDAGSFGRNTFAVVGWSDELSRVLAWEMRATAFFVPRLTTRFGQPWIDALDVACPVNQADIVQLARMQMARLRDDFPALTGGPLTLAHVSRGRVSTWLIDNWFTAPECAEGMTDDIGA